MTLATEQSVEVPLPPERAFHLFTEGISRWWPLEKHSVSAMGEDGPAQGIAMDLREGGEVTETLATGKTSVWATLLRYDPPRSFELRWHPGQPPEMATRVIILFEPVNDGTRVTIRHDGFEVRGAGAKAARDGYASGWPGILARFAAFAETVIPASI